MIQAGPKVVDDLAERTDKYGGDLTGGVVFGLLQKQVRLFIADNWVFGVLQEPVDFGLRLMMFSWARFSFSWIPSSGLSIASIEIGVMIGA